MREVVFYFRCLHFSKLFTLYKLKQKPTMLECLVFVQSEAGASATFRKEKEGKEISLIIK